MTYNFNENISDNYYNCPVVAYYPELLSANMPVLKRIKYYAPYVGLHKPSAFKKRAVKWFFDEFNISPSETKAAVDAAYAAYKTYKSAVPVSYTHLHC